MKRTKKVCRVLRPASTSASQCYVAIFFCFLSPRSGNTWRQPLLEASQKPLNLIGVSGTAAHKQFKTCFSVITVTAATNNTMSRV